jgi:hypothetical protein
MNPAAAAIPALAPNRAERRAQQRLAQRKPSGKEPRKPKGLLYDPMTYVTEGISPSPDGMLAKLRIIELGSIDAFARGAAQAMDFYNLVALHDIAAAMAKAGIGPEVLDDCRDAVYHFRDTLDRHERTGHWGATGPALVAWRGLYAAHDAQRTAVPRKDYEDVVGRVVAERRRVEQRELLQRI